MTKAAKNLDRLISKGSVRIESDGTALIGRARVSAMQIKHWCQEDLARIEAGRLAPTQRARCHQDRRKAAGDTTQRYQAQHQQRRRAGSGRAAPVRNLCESPLDWLASHKDAAGHPYISTRQFDAGEKLRQDFETAGLGPRVTRNYQAPPVAKSRSGAAGPSRDDPAMVQVLAKQRFDRAMAAAGADLADILWQVCCFEAGLADAERALGWPTRSGKLVLRIALDRLADHYIGKK